MVPWFKITIGLIVVMLFLIILYDIYMLPYLQANGRLSGRFTTILIPKNWIKRTEQPSSSAKASSMPIERPRYNNRVPSYDTPVQPRSNHRIPEPSPFGMPSVPTNNNDMLVTVVIPPGITAPPQSDPETKPLQEISQPIRSSGCEGDTITFSCPTGKTIQLANAFYGRNSPNVCPGPNSGTTTTCNDSFAQATLLGIVNGKNNATVKMANIDKSGPFLDPCAGVFKHFDVTYNCV
jgi:hypothetical protein